MTREEEIIYAALDSAKKYGVVDNSICFKAFKKGAEWADQHQPSPWISVEDRLPKEGLMIARYNNGLAFSYYMLGKWIVQCAAIGRPLINETPTHWMPIPELKGGEK